MRNIAFTGDLWFNDGVFIYLKMSHATGIVDAPKGLSVAGTNILTWQTNIANAAVFCRASGINLAV